MGSGFQTWERSEPYKYGHAPSQEHGEHDLPALLDLKVVEVMSAPVVTVGPESSVRDASRIMGGKHIGSVVALVSGKLQGILTERDVLSKVLYTERDLNAALVRDTMNPKVGVVAPEISVKQAAKAMMVKKTKLVVADGDRVMGIVAASDLIRVLSKARVAGRPLEGFMVKKVASLDEEATIRDAIRLMVEKRIGSVIIKKNESPLGIFAERDLMTKVLAKDLNLDAALGRFASYPLIHAPPSTSIQQAAKLMVNNKIRRLPVFDKGKLLGIVTARDLVEEMVEHLS